MSISFGLHGAVNENKRCKRPCKNVKNSNMFGFFTMVARFIVTSDAYGICLRDAVMPQFYIKVWTTLCLTKHLVIQKKNSLWGQSGNH